MVLVRLLMLRWLLLQWRCLLLLLLRRVGTVTRSGALRGCTGQGAELLIPCAGASSTGGGCRRTGDDRSRRLVLPAVGRHHGVDGIAMGPMSKRNDRAALIHAIGLSEVAHSACAARTLRDVQAARQAVPGELHTRDLGLDVLPERALRVSGIAPTTLPGGCGGGCVVAPRRGAIRIRELVRARPVRRIALRRILEGALVEVALRALILGILCAGVGAGLL
mmetsp:Transcript_25668/g.54218  ORF Transcript_25668/g.54218 Transcript_25668/m.54218 type:complete len:221 (-) Transcript_25668:1257-1919(-)